MIEVENLTKAYGPVPAVDHVSFSVHKGEILGFRAQRRREDHHHAHPHRLYAGDVGYGARGRLRRVHGFHGSARGTSDIFPKRLPVYPDMSVATYLDFVLRIKNIPADKRRARVDDALEKTNLGDKRNQLIKRLSRGYKQRVGLAQALVHDPDVIILDEPTVGLDPKQIIEVRHLIKNLAGNHTIILSTHILPEVSMTCERVVIINKGKIAAVDTPLNLTTQLKSGQRIQIEAKAPEKALARTARPDSRRRQGRAWDAAGRRAHRRNRRGRARTGSTQCGRREDCRKRLAAV